MSDWMLEKHGGHEAKGPVLLCVLDGVGLRAEREGNAVALARTPVLDGLATQALSIPLQAHGTAVGMPSDSDMGNSEVGHNAMGAGRVFAQGAKLVQEAIRSGSIFESKAWTELSDNCLKNSRTWHFLGLLSDGNVHSHIEHLIAMLRRCSSEGVERVRLHVLLDGRDVPDESALQYVDVLEQVLSEINRTAARDYRIASGGGRMVTTMDRYNADWSIVERGYKAHVLGEAQGFPSAREAIEHYRKKSPGISDQQLPAFVVQEMGNAVGPMHDGDSVVMFNFRGDRAIEISRALTEKNFSEFDRGRFPHLHYAGMLQYDGDLAIPPRFLVDPPAIDRCLGEYLAHNHVTQLAISETQKFGHVTYFWNGNRSGKFDESTEHYIEIPSDRCAFDEKPEMKAPEITDSLITELESGKYRFARVNYANGDMVGHTGNLEASIRAMECLDAQVGRLNECMKKLGGATIVTADHGNVEEMYLHKSGVIQRDEKGVPLPKTSHTLNPVPCYVVYEQHRYHLNTSVKNPGLANLAASVLYLLGYRAPKDYNASLITD